MAGSSTEPSAAASPISEPVMPDRIISTTTTAWLRPPAIHPTTTFARFTSRVVMPPAVMRLPASRKNGIARNGHESTVAAIFT
jgi:hypothetical protein